MQALREHLDAITRILEQLGHPDMNALSNAKNLKSVSFVIDRVLDMLNAETCALQQLKLRTLKRMDTCVDTVRAQLEAAERQFMVQYVPEPSSPHMRTIPVQIAGMTHTCAVYGDKRDVPVLSYGVIMLGEPVIVFRYSERDWVSVTACHVMDGATFDQNIHTVCCGNGATCEYGVACRYYHDPVEWPESTHVQRFHRTHMVKRCPQFGNAPDFCDQAATLTFDQLRTLARYCAVQMLLIHIVARSK